MRAAVVGVGRMGQRHAQAVRDVGFELVGVCDQSEQALAEAVRQFNLSENQRFTEVASLLERARPECLIIATTAPTHSAYTCMAAERGVRYILCEKPMAVSLAECDRMIEACKRHGVQLAINHQMRFMPYYTETKRLVQSEEFGGLASVTVVAGNFGLAMNGTHYFEMFRYMTDEAPREVQAWFSDEKVPNPRGAQFEDRAGQVRVTNGRGQRLYMEVGADQGHGIKVVYAGMYGQLVFDEFNGTMQWVVREAEHRSQPTTRYGMPWTENARQLEPTDYSWLMQSVLKGLVDGTAPSGEEGRMAVATLVGAYLSDESGHTPIRLDQHLPTDRIFPWA